ncbi:MAG: nitrite/sulfite reductase, partial [Chloroflexi bacterium]|nr:nitrite/sulfite reductase [Chloroflexota bacterium]
AQRVPDAVATLIDYYREHRNEGEPFGDWAIRAGKAEIKEAMADYQEMPEYEKDPMAFVDWGGTKLFSLDEMGEGECSV